MRPEEDQEQTRIQLGCALAAAIGIAFLLLVLFGIVYLFFVALGHLTIAAAAVERTSPGLAPNSIVRLVSATGYDHLLCVSGQTYPLGEQGAGSFP